MSVLNWYKAKPWASARNELHGLADKLGHNFYSIKTSYQDSIEKVDWFVRANQIVTLHTPLIIQCSTRKVKSTTKKDLKSLRFKF